jgi:hypothetical protein
MNRKNIDNKIFLDFDKLVLMNVEEFHYANANMVLMVGFKVNAITDNGLKIPDLFVDKDSGKADSCQNWILNNWIKK